MNIKVGGREAYDQAAHPAMLVKTAMMDGMSRESGDGES